LPEGKSLAEREEQDGHRPGNPCPILLWGCRQVILTQTRSPCLYETISECPLFRFACYRSAPTLSASIHPAIGAEDKPECIRRRVLRFSAATSTNRRIIG
jgi:hypothetical protein